jgi:hypothetical protein
MLGPSHWLHEISLPKRLGHHNVFIFQVLLECWYQLVRISKKKIAINGDLLLKPFKNEITSLSIYNNQE